MTSSTAYNTVTSSAATGAAAAAAGTAASLLEVKSKYDAEFRRFGLNRFGMNKFDDFYQLLERLHGLCGIQFNIYYTDKDGELLPINNDNNLARVLHVTMGILRLIIFRKGECYPDHTGVNGFGTNYSTTGVNHQHTGSNYSHLNYSNSNSINTSLNTNNLNSNNANSTSSYRAVNLINHIKELSTTLTSSSGSQNNPKPFFISYPEDFRPVSAIIDVDILPDTYRRVRLHKHKSSKPLGFYIRDGRSLRVTPNGVEQVPGIFISRLMPGGLAESTGLLSVNDEVIEVNGIEVAGKTLDQVTDMMVANSSNLIITVKPTNQKYNLNRSNLNKSQLGNNTTLNTSNNSSISKSSRNMTNPTQLKSDMSKSSVKSNDMHINHLNNTSGLNNHHHNNNNNGSSLSSSSVNSSFSSSNQQPAAAIGGGARHSFNKNTTTTNNNNPTKTLQQHQSSAGVVDNEQIKLDFKSSLSSTKVLNENDHDEDDHEQSSDEDDDDDDDEEIHDAIGGNTHHHQYHHHHHRNSPDNNSSSDDKILTL